MQVSVEHAQGLARRLAVTIPAEEVESEVDKRLREMRGNLRLKGFRPGKVPFDLVKKRYSGQVRQEVLGEVINSSYRDAVTQEGLNPAGVPEIEPRSTPPEEPFEYVASFEVYPTIELTGLEAIRVDRPVAEVTEADVDAMLERLRLQRREWDVVERPAAMGDQVTLDYRGALEEGQALEGGSQEGLDVVLGEGGLAEGFAHGVVGMSAGDERQIPVTFAEDYAKADVRGKTVRFDVKVHRVAQARLPELNEDFAKAFEVEDGNLDTLRSQVREKMTKDLDNTVRAQIKKRVMEALLEANPIEVPRALVNQEIDALKKQAMEAMAGKSGGNTGGGSAEQLPDSLFDEDAQRRVRLGLMVAEVTRRQNIQPDPDRVRAIVEDQARDYEKPDEFVRWYYSEPNLRKQVEMIALENQVVDWVLQQVQVTDVSLDFETVVKSS